jgi:osmoprotectant transport system ATP-binding protein
VVFKAGRVIADDTPRALMRGNPDADVAALMSMPVRQAERVQAIMRGLADG